MIRRRSTAPRVRVVAAVVAALLLSAGCDADGGGDEADTRAHGAGSVVAPGRPGEPARTLSPSQAAKEAAVDSPNTADVRYVRRMILHHTQALEMTALVPSRARSSSVKRLAARITAAQRPEIGAMEGWLSRHGKDEKAAGHDDHAAMPGMATAAQLEELRAAKGAAFDRLFLDLMITHHQGAVTMATEVLSQGNNVQVEEMADDVVAQQTSEIGRMRALSP